MLFGEVARGLAKSEYYSKRVLGNLHYPATPHRPLENHQDINYRSTSETIPTTTSADCTLANVFSDYFDDTI